MAGIIIGVILLIIFIGIGGWLITFNYLQRKMIKQNKLYKENQIETSAYEAAEMKIDKDTENANIILNDFKNEISVNFNEIGNFNFANETISTIKLSFFNNKSQTDETAFLCTQFPKNKDIINLQKEINKILIQTILGNWFIVYQKNQFVGYRSGIKETMTTFNLTNNLLTKDSIIDRFSQKVAVNDIEITNGTNDKTLFNLTIKDNQHNFKGIFVNDYDYAMRLVNETNGTGYGYTYNTVFYVDLTKNENNTTMLSHALKIISDNELKEIFN